MIKKTLNEKIWLISLLILFLATLIYLYNHTLKFGVWLIVIVIFQIIALFLIYYNKAYFNKLKIEKCFVIIASFLGIIYILLAPLFTGSDEQNHYYRIYEISQGTIFTPTNNNVVGSMLPVSLQYSYILGGASNTNIKYSNIPDMFKVKLNSNIVTQYGLNWHQFYSNTALYSPIVYIPQSLGFNIAKLFNLNVYLIGIFGRLFNLLFYIIVGYLAIKIAPKAKMFFLAILCSPNMLSTATTLSADAFTNVISLLYISIIFYYIFNKVEISFKSKLLLFILSLIISLSKVVYFPIVFLLLLLKSECFKNTKKEKGVFLLVTIFSSLVFSFLWINTTDNIFNISYSNTALQKQFILNNILSYILIIFKTFLNYGFDYIECLFVGTTMYHSQLKIPLLISFSYIILVILTLIKDNNDNILSKKSKALIIFIALIVIGLICTSIYIQCTAQYYDVANNIIEGIQGRYFIPIILFIPYLLKIKPNKLNYSNTLIYCSIITFNTIVWMFMINQFI